MNRNSNGEYRQSYWKDVRVLVLSVIGIVLLMIVVGTFNSWYSSNAAQNVVSYVAQKAEAQVVREEKLTVEQLEAKLDAIVWGGESQNKVMKDGEIFPVFDPSSAMYAQCIKIGGKQHKDCLSYGPRQEKIGTIQHYWPKLHDGVEISDKEAREIAEGNDTSRRFFLDCAVQIKGCADNWRTFSKRKTEGQIYLDLIREAKGLVL